MTDKRIITKYIVIGVPESTMHLSPELLGVYDSMEDAKQATRDAITVERAQSAVFRPVRFRVSGGDGVRVSDVRRHVVQYSGGVCSFLAAKRVVEQHGTDGVTLLFCDTRMEDEDTYRFIVETQRYLGCELVTIADGRDPWTVYRDEGFLGNSRIAPCTKKLKTIPARKWLTANCDPEITTLYVGIDWTEVHRADPIREHWRPWRVEFPMMQAPYLVKEDMLDVVSDLGITPPRLYRAGFTHNNCGGMCCRAGVAHWAHLLEEIPERFERAEAMEETWGGQTMLTRSVDGKRVPYSLKQLRLDHEAQLSFDAFDLGGCGCFA